MFCYGREYQIYSILAHEIIISLHALKSIYKINNFISQGLSIFDICMFEVRELIQSPEISVHCVPQVCHRISGM